MTRFLPLALFCALIIFLSSPVIAGSKYTAFTVTVSGKGKPVIFIPGATCSGDEWNETVAEFSGKYECHVLTLAGYAGTPPLPGAPYLPTMKDQIISYIKTNNLKDVTIVGHSIGGVMAMLIAIENPAQLGRIVVVDAMPFFAAERIPGAKDGFDEAKAEESLKKYSAMSDEELKATQLRTAKFMCLDSTKWPSIIDWGMKSDKKTMAYTMTEMNGMDLREKVSKIAVPALVLVAYTRIPEYPAFTREAVSGRFSDQYKNCSKCTLHVSEDKTKHFIMYDDPKWFYSELRQFLKG